MTSVIIYQNPQADNVCVCVPTGEISIQEVLAKDCPSGAQIVDSSSLPVDNTYFNAWRMEDGKVYVDLDVAREIATSNLNNWARGAVAKLAEDEAIGIRSVGMSREELVTILDAGRSRITEALTTEEMTRAVEETKAVATTAIVVEDQTVEDKSEEV